jgi:glycosyltransferase involved in cell wall biosynthesis
MNVILVDAIDFPFGGAHSVHVSLFMQGLRENNANAFLVIPYGKKREAVAANKKQYGHFDGIPYCFVRYSKKMAKALRFFDVFLGAIHTAALLYRRKKSKKLDAVILGGITDIIRDSPIILTCAIFRIPMYFWLVEKASLLGDSHGLPGFLNKKSQQLSERAIPKFARGLLVISTAIKKHYLKYLPERKILISPILVSENTHNSVNAASVEVVKQKMQQQYVGKRLLVYSGSFGEKDGIYFLIDAFEIIVKKYPDAVFVMTGKHPDSGVMARVKNYIEQRSLQDSIQLPGFVNANELISYNALANVLLACRSNSAFANHGFPWKLGEYCMTERPVIATRVSDIDKYFTDGEDLFIVEPDQPNAIAQKVSFIFENYKHALAVAQKGKQTAVREFNYLSKGADVVSFIKLLN